MSEIEIKLKQTNENNKELFNFSGGEAQLKHLKEVFTDTIKQSKQVSNIFKLLFKRLH